MFNSSINFVFFLIIVLIFTTTDVCSTSCYGSQISCSTYSGTNWCCDYDETCGTSYGSCLSSSSLPPAIIAIIIVASIFCFVVCLSCCISQQRQQQQQRLQTAYRNANNRVVTSPYQQHVVRGPVRVVRVRPVYNVTASPAPQPYPSMYEAPPPSYEVATASIPSVHQSSSFPPVTANVEQSN